MMQQIIRQSWLLVCMLILCLSSSAIAQKTIDTGATTPAPSPTPTPPTNNTQEDYRQLLLDTIALVDQSGALSNSNSLQLRLLEVQDTILQMDSFSLQLMVDKAPQLEILQAKLTQAELMVGSVIATREIEFPEPEISISQCDNESPDVAFAVLVTVFVSREILTALTWPCLETVEGENSAVGCAVANVINALLEISFEIEEACLAEQRAAHLTAALETDENIAEHLNEYVDETTSSRASQDSLDDLQSDVTDTLDLLADLQSGLDADLATVDDELGDVFTDLDTLLTNTTTLASQANDIQFRVMANQADIEDAQGRAANVQQIAAEILTDTESIVATLISLQSSINGLQSGVSDSLEQAGKDAIAAALIDSDSDVLRFRLPLAAGGELERVRELVIQSIIAFDGIGAKTTTALQLVDQGDQAFNQQDYFAAYGFFAQAYQSLLGAPAPFNPGGIR